MRMPPQGLTDQQLFPVESAIAIRLSDTIGTGLPTTLFNQILELNPGVSANRLFYLGTGTKPSSGYGLFVQEVRFTRKRLSIIVKETKPSPQGGFFSDVITYPGLWFRVPKKWKVNSFNVRWQ